MRLVPEVGVAVAIRIGQRELGMRLMCVERLFVGHSSRCQQVVVVMQIDGGNPRGGERGGGRRGRR